MKIKNPFSKVIAITLAFFMIILVGCSNKDTAKTNDVAGKPIVAVTIVPEETFVRAVCGDLVDVVTIVPPGNSPENYEPTPQVIEKLSKASLYFSIGVPTEQANIMPIIGDIKVVPLQDEVAKVYPDRTFESGERDPHIWLSPKRVKVMVETIAKEMSILDEENKETYENNAKEYINKLDELDKEIASSLVNLDNKKIIVYHPAFGYLTDDYGLEMFALEEEGKEATPQHLQKMIDLAKKENIKVIFYQEEIDSRQSQAYAEEIGGKTAQLAPLSPDYIENLKKMAQAITEVK